MSDADNSSYPYGSSQQGFQFSFLADHHNMYNHPKHQNPTEIFDFSDISFFQGGYNTPSAASAAFDPSCSSSEAAAFAAKNCDASSSYDKINLGETSCENLPTTPNSSVSFAGVEEADSCRSKQVKVCKEEEEEGGDLKPTKV